MKNLQRKIPSYQNHVLIGQEEDVVVIFAWMPRSDVVKPGWSSNCTQQTQTFFFIIRSNFRCFKFTCLLIIFQTEVPHRCPSDSPQESSQSSLAPPGRWRRDWSGNKRRCCPLDSASRRWSDRRTNRTHTYDSSMPSIVQKVTILGHLD